MKFRFPIVIIDEDYRSDNTSGLGIRALAEALQAEGFGVLGVTRYGDLSQFAQQQSRASAFILSIDHEAATLPVVSKAECKKYAIRPNLVISEYQQGQFHKTPGSQSAMDGNKKIIKTPNICNTTTGATPR